MDSADVSKINVEGGGGHVTTLGGLVDQSAANANNINDIKNSLYGTNDQPGLTERMNDLKDYADRIQGLANGAAAGVRENRENISELQGNIDEVAGDLATETQNRTDADTKLQGNIDEVADDLATETQNRTEADTKLQGNIDEVADDLAAETQNRTEADTKLQGNIDEVADDLAAETQNRTDADTKLQGNIDEVADNLATETQNRTDADTKLQGNIDEVADDLATETQNRTDADTKLQGNIDEVADNLATETQNRIEADTKLQGNIDKVNNIVGDGNLTNGGSTLTEGININSAAIAQNRQDINNLNRRVDNLDSRIDKVGAGAAALAALHPLDFDPDAKWDFAAGYGNYNGENAVAVGTFYRPNEDTMFSVGGTFGNGENMINAGVSLKIGAGSSHVTTSRTAMAKEIKSMRDVVAKQDAQIQKLTAMVNALVGVQTETDTTTMFPDVPENHWAYEAVAAMAKSGLVKGYPDGEFKGDRNMTRYEFAQIVYNAIQAGAEVDARLVEEFKPELEYFHIATVAKDKEGNPTIERVRAN